MTIFFCHLFAPRVPPLLRASASNRQRRSLAKLTLLLLFASLCHAQAQGQADIAVQGYYLGGNSQPLVDTTGTAIRFQSLIPGVGYLSGNLEAYGSQSRLRTGENYLELRG